MCPQVIEQHGNEKSTIYRWFSIWMPMYRFQITMSYFHMVLKNKLNIIKPSSSHHHVYGWIWVVCLLSHMVWVVYARLSHDRLSRIKPFSFAWSVSWAETQTHPPGLAGCFTWRFPKNPTVKGCWRMLKGIFEETSETWGYLEPWFPVQLFPFTHWFHQQNAVVWRNKNIWNNTHWKNILFRGLQRTTCQHVSDLGPITGR